MQGELAEKALRHRDDAGEVAQVLTVPLAERADPAHRFRVHHPSGLIGPAFDVGGLVVWGFTAGILTALLDLGGWAVPWDTDDLRPTPGLVDAEEQEIGHG